GLSRRTQADAARPPQPARQPRTSPPATLTTIAVRIPTPRSRHSWKDSNMGLLQRVFQTLRYHNLSSAVKKILRGRQRVEAERIIAIRSHWGIRSEYCNPERGNEKGGVDCELGASRAQRRAHGVSRWASQLPVC